MDWSETIEKEREMLKRIIALFYALARLTDRVYNRSRPVRCFVLWILKPAVVIALDCIADTGPVHQTLIWQRTDSLAEARRFSRCFRAAARSMKGLLKALDRCEAYGEASPTGFNYPPIFEAMFNRRFAYRDLRNFITATAGLLRRASAQARLVPESCDTS